MDDTQVTEQTPQTPDEAFAAFDKLLDVREPVETPAPEEHAEAPAEAAPVEEAEKPAEPVKLDKRTKEGRKASIQAEIDEAVKQREETRRELAALRAERDALKAPVSAKPAPVVDHDAEPDPTDLTKYPDGQFDRKFIKDLGEWAADQRLKTYERQQTEARTNARWQEIGQSQMATLQEKVAAVEKDKAGEYFAALPDYLAELAPSGSLTPEGRQFVQTPEGKDLAVRCAIMDSIVEAENSKAILDHLVNHPDTFQRLLTLPPDALFREMGRLDARMGAASTRPGPTLVTSKANPPIKPLGSDASAADDETLADDLPIEEFIKRGNRQQAARSRR